MKLTDETTPGTNFVRAYGGGEIRVGETVLRRSCVLRADQLIPDWRPRQFEDLQAGDFDVVLALDPQIIVLGTGVRQRFPAPELLTKIFARGVGCEVMDTGAACRTYNVLVSEDRKVVAALLL